MELIITEKQKSAQKVAEALDSYKSINIGKQKIYVLTKKPIIVSHVSGHICTWAYKEKQSWKNTDFRKLVYSKPVEKYIIGYEQYFLEIFKKYKIEKIGLFTDKDSEGELIGLTIDKLILKIKKKLNISSLETYRYTTSALSNQAIKVAVANKEKLDYNLAQSARAKHHIDLQWGAVLTVMFTNLGKIFYSVGRVQTPTLALVVERHNKILNHVPKPYYVITLYCEKGIIFKSEQIDNIEANIIEKIKNTKLISFNENIKQNTLYPPKPLNSTDLLKFSVQMGVDAKTCMSYAESLYLKGLISYPRSDSRFTTFEEIKKVYDILKPGTFFEPYSISVGTKDEAHPPIMPTINKPTQLSNLESKLYNLIYEHYLDILKGPYIYKLYTYCTTLESINFYFKSEKVIRQGYKPQRQFIQLKDSLKVIEVIEEKKQSKPPFAYTEGTIIKKMEQLKIGTKSTRHTFVPLLRTPLRGYLVKFTPQKKAFNLINIMNRYIPAITSAQLTENIEQDLTEIAKGRKTFDQVILKYTEILWAIIEKINSKKQSITRELIMNTSVEYKTYNRYNNYSRKKSTKK